MLRYDLPTLYREEKFVIRASDGASIYGYIDQASEQRSQKLVVFSHGLTGSPREYHFKQGQRYFNAAGFDVVRFAYYAAEPGARRLQDCTLQIHASDLNTVCDHFRTRYGKLYIVGHSYGGLTILFAPPIAKAYSFWDSAFVPYDSLWRHGADYIPELDRYVLRWSSDHVVGTAMVEEAKALTAERAHALARAVRVPSQVAIAGVDSEHLPRNGLFDALQCRKSQVGFAAADHEFTVGETVFDLLDATRDWFASVDSA